MKATMNLMDLWIEWQMRCWYTGMRLYYPLSMAFLPGPNEDLALRRWVNVQRQRIDNIEKRLHGEGI
mgnify:CR=1 FL=1